MQLDRARIAIHERSWATNLDLALHVLRAGGPQMLAVALIGIFPAMLVNYLLTRGAVRDSYESWTSFGYWIVCLVMIEAPLVTAPLTLYLGQALFVERPDTRQIGRDILACLPQLLLLQGLLRAVLILPLVTCFIPYGMWPYLNEITLLERNPFMARDGRLSTLKRSRLLHAAGGGEFLARAFLTLLLAPLLFVALWFTQGFLLSTLFGFQLGNVGHAIAAQAVLWVIVVYFTVARFLGYLDQRIRGEGWEVELFLRTERSKLARQLT